MGGHYPPLGITAATPSSYTLSSRTTRILAPGLVVGTVIVLVICSLIGLSISSSVFTSGSPHTRSESASQAFVLLAVSPLSSVIEKRSSADGGNIVILLDYLCLPTYLCLDEK